MFVGRGRDRIAPQRQRLGVVLEQRVGATVSWLRSIKK